MTNFQFVGIKSITLTLIPDSFTHDSKYLL